MPLDLLPGLLEESLEHAARAWQRRSLVANNPRFNLRALSVMDEAVDRAVMSTRFYGEYAKRFLDAQVELGDPEMLDAWHFLRLAHSLQVHSPDAILIAESITASHPLLVRDAYWHYPVPASLWLASADHALPLLEVASEPLLRVGIEIAGLVDARAAQKALSQLVERERYTADALLALARQGVEHPRHAKAVKDTVASTDPTEREWGLRVAVTLGKNEWLKPYDTIVARIGPENSLAWCAWACLQPRRAADASLQNLELAPHIRFGVAAITGYVDALIPLLASTAQSETNAEPYECDLMYLVLGMVPMEATVVPQDREAKSIALKELLVRVLRESHITLNNEANKTQGDNIWDTDAIVHDVKSQREVRVREGRRLLSAA
jgi:hypothetical protein